MAFNRGLPRVSSVVHLRYRVPHGAEVVVGVIVAPVVVLADIHNAIGFSSFAMLTYCAIANMSRLRSMRVNGYGRATYKVPCSELHDPLVQPTGNRGGPRPRHSCSPVPWCSYGAIARDPEQAPSSCKRSDRPAIIHRVDREAVAMSRSKVYLQVERVDAAVCERAAQASVSDLHEAMGSPMCRLQTMASAMRPLIQGLRVAGPAITASCPPGDNLMMHRALFLAGKGDVLVVASPEAGAQWGDVAAYYALRKGLAGIVVDGFIRDVDELRAMGSPVWATKIGSSSPQKVGHGLVNTPVVCAGVRVEPGDLVVADGDGVIVLPRRDSAAIVERALDRTRREASQRAEIDGGGHPWHMHGAAANYAKMNIEEIDEPWNP